MDIVVIGGTRFIGRHFVDAALKSGHQVTIFHRGATNPGLFEDAEGVEKILGDRTTDIERLDGHWDVAVDTCGYVPAHVRTSTEHLRQRVDHYVFISTISVYRDFSKKGIDERAPVKTLEMPELDEVNPSTYGPLKTECEAIVDGVFNRHHTVVRPGVVAGPHDPTDRFTYWVWRVAAGGEVLAPGDPSARVQLLDVRDLANWLVHCVETTPNGNFNATGESVSFEQMLHACRRASGSDAEFTWVSRQFLNRMELDESSKMPFFNPEADGRKAGLYAVDSSRARELGLHNRPLEQTARDTLDWIGTDEQHDWQAGIDRLQEREILEVWHGG